MERRDWLLIHIVALVAFGFAFLCSADARAAVMLTPVTADTDMGESGPGGEVENMINQSGLDKPYMSGLTDFDEYFTTGDPAFAQATAGNNWQSETQFTLPVTGNVDFDFGAVHSIDRLAVWNISMKDIKVHVSDTSLASLQEVGSFTLPDHTSFFFSYSHDLLNLGQARDVRFLRIEVDSVHLFDPSFTFGFAIVGEVVASAVPADADLDGDYNDNGTVDAADYTVWRDNLGAATGLPNDTTPSGVGPEDFDVWKTNFGAMGGLGAGASVPEPATWALAAVISVVVAARRAARRPSFSAFSVCSCSI